MDHTASTSGAHPRRRLWARAMAGSALVLSLGACQTPPQAPTDPQQALIDRGRTLFFNETFGGNGRTCGTCHPATNNFTLDPAFIATLPDDDPLFVAEFVPALRQNFENPRLMRQFALIVENLDGFGDLANVFVMRGIPHTLGLRHTVASNAGPRTGWSGDGAPGDGSLRAFATGAVIQHFTLTTNRVPGVDFRLPTDDELDAMEAFQLSLGRQDELALPLALRGSVARRGQEIFLDNATGKCNICHSNAGANAVLGGNPVGNVNLDTGVENLTDQPIDQIGERVPPDDGFGTPGDGTFNIPSLIEAADTPPFFHNNAITTLEGAVAFYNSDAFNQSPSGQVLAGLDPRGIGIRLDTTQVEAVSAFLRVINALDNIRQAIELLHASTRRDAARELRRDFLRQAAAEIEDAAQVLRGAGLHAPAATLLEAAQAHAAGAADSAYPSRRHDEVVRLLEQARAELIES